LDGRGFEQGVPVPARQSAGQNHISLELELGGLQIASS
jgi:hypothetical protein